MAGVAGEHRAAARLRHVAHQQPGQPVLRALAASRSRTWIRSGWPQLRLRERRITCQVLPSIGNLGTSETTFGIKADVRASSAPAGLAAEQFLGGVAGSSGLANRGSGSGLTLPLSWAHALAALAAAITVDERDQNQARVHRITQVRANVA